MQGRTECFHTLGLSWHDDFMPKTIRLSGREASVLRGIGFGLGIKGDELLERLQMAPEDLLDVLNTLLDAGYVETASMKEKVAIEEMSTEEFEVNPSYAADLKQAMRRS
jgi:hypothetical protein